MKHKINNLSQSLYDIIQSSPTRSFKDISHAICFAKLLHKYGFNQGHIITKDYKIFKNMDICKKYRKFIMPSFGSSRPIKSITISQVVRSHSYHKDFDNIYKNLSKNIDNIIYFQNKFNIAVAMEIHLSGIDAFGAIEISNFIVNNDIDYIDFIFVFPALNENLATSLISDIEQLSINPILENPKIRLVNFPFCFIPDAKYKYLYRNIIDLFKGNVFFQQETLRKLKRKKNSYHKPCRICRCKVSCYTYTDIQRAPHYTTFISPKTRKTIAFVGGSLYGKGYRNDVDIVYTTPAEQGDMFMAMLEGFKNIIIIDGYFYAKFPCTTFEVTLALEQGINVFGASSIGALRAVELNNYGMTGIGYVYEYLKKQIIKPYHIVAQTYNEQNEPLSISLINIIYFLECALSEGIIGSAAFKNCLGIAESIHFSVLSFKYFFQRLNSKLKIPLHTILKLKEYLSNKGEEFFNIKSKDALLLLSQFKKVLKHRPNNYVKKTFNQAKERYLKALYAKYSCNYGLSLPQDWKSSLTKQLQYLLSNSRDNREYSAKRTCELAKKFFQDLDIVIADTTKYDAANSFVVNIFFIPFYFLEYSPSSATGNGEVFKEALACAYMELIERIPISKFHIKTLAHNKVPGARFPSADLPQYYNWDRSNAFKNKMFRDSGYVEVTDILSSKNIFIPKGVAIPLTSGSDGNASGNSLAEAILYAIYELIERDSVQVYRSPICAKFIPKLIINKKDIRFRRTQVLLKQFETKGCEIDFLNLVNIYNIPCVVCIAYDLNHGITLHRGVAARSDFESAIFASLSETYMQYITYFVGSRDDYQAIFDGNMRIKQPQTVSAKEKNNLHIRPSLVHFNSIRQELEYVINKLISANIRHIIVVNTSPNSKYTLKSVKAIIPELELFSITQYKPSLFYAEKAKHTAALITGEIRSL